MKMWYFKNTFNFLLLGWKSIIPDNYLKISYQWLYLTVMLFFNVGCNYKSSACQKILTLIH